MLIVRKNGLHHYYSQLLCLINVLIYLCLIRDSYVHECMYTARKCLHKINMSDRDFFNTNFRSDIVIVVRECFDKQINKMFGIYSLNGWIKDVVRLFVHRKPKMHVKHGNPYVKRENVGKYNDRLLRMIYGTRLSRYMRFAGNWWPRMKGRYYCWYENVESTCLAWIVATVTWPFRNDEIFLEMESGRFVPKRFYTPCSRNRYIRNSRKLFFFTDMKEPISAFKCHDKRIHDRIFTDYFHPVKLQNLLAICNAVEKALLGTQTSPVDQLIFFALSESINSRLWTAGIDVRTTFAGTRLACINIRIQVVTYDTISVIRTVLVMCNDRMVASLFSTLKLNFFDHAKMLRRNQAKTRWNTAYIDSVMVILQRYGILKRQIDLSVYPEVVGLMFPYEFVHCHELYVHYSVILRSCVHFGHIRQFCAYGEYFDDEMVGRVQAYTDEIMFSVV